MIAPSPSADRGDRSLGVKATTRQGGVRGRTRAWFAADPYRSRYTKAMLVTGVAAAIVFALVLSTVSENRLLGNYYDIQARAILDGHLDVPEGILGQEAIVHDGRHYMYWAPGPALLRIPVLLVTDRFDGRLTPLMMMAAWALTTVLLALLIWRIRGLVVGHPPLRRWEVAGYALFLFSSVAGSTILYLVSIPWVYHEAYMWAIAMALGTTYTVLGVFENPGPRRVLYVGLFVLGGVLSRGTAGYAGVGIVLLCAVWFALGRRGRAGRRVWPALLAAGLVPLAIAMSIAWVKFESFNSYPLAAQVHSSVSEYRQAALEANGGDLFSVDLVPSTLLAYLRPDGIRFSWQYPFVDAPAERPSVVGDGFFDTLNRTPSVVSFMPLLVGLAGWGVIAVLRGRRRPKMLWIALPLAGMGAIPVFVLWISAITPRFTAEFLPFLYVGGAVGVVDIAHRLGRRPRSERRFGLAAIAVLCAFGVFANLAYALNTRAMADAGDHLETQIRRQLWVSRLVGDGLDDLVVSSVSLPVESRPGEIRIIGDCQALYYGTGEHGHTTRPWLEVGTRPVIFDLVGTAEGSAEASASIPLAEFSGLHRAVLTLVNDDQGLRLALSGGGADSTGPPFRLAEGESMEVAIVTDRLYTFEVTLDGETILEVDKEDRDSLFQSLPNLLSPSLPTPTQTAALGVEVEDRSPAPEALCSDLLELARQRG